MAVDKDLLNHLLSFITEARQNRLHEVLEHRTRFLTVVLEDIYQPQNASAVIRSCDCFGIQDLYIIENENEYRLNPDVTRGSSNWVDLHFYNETNNNTEQCLTDLKEKGYQLVATTPHTEETSLDTFNVEKPTALMLGTEMHGLSELALNMADVRMKIPMYGFTESFNISVSAALCMSHLSSTIRQNRTDWKLTQDEKDEILLGWARNTVKRSEVIERTFYEGNTR